MNAIDKLLTIEAIKQLKYAYLRAVDLKLWDELEGLLTEDVTSSYDDGEYSFNGRAAVMEFLRSSLGSNKIITKHQVHHPEIRIADDGQTASGVWYLTDAVISMLGPEDKHINLTGTAFYHDDYVLVNGEWKISDIGYRRVYEEVISRKDQQVTSFRSCFTAPEE